MRGIDIVRHAMPDQPSRYAGPGYISPWWNMIQAAHVMGIEFCGGCDALLGHPPQSIESGGLTYSTAPMRGHQPWCRSVPPSVLDPVIEQHEAWARFLRSAREP